MPVVNPMNALSDAERQQAYNLLQKTWAGVDPSIMSQFGNYWNSFNDPYKAWTDSGDLIAQLNAAMWHDPWVDTHYYDPNAYKGEGAGPGFGVPPELLQWAYSQNNSVGPEAAYDGSAYQINPQASGIFGNLAAGASFLPLAYVQQNVGHYQSIDPNFDISKLKTVNHPVIGPVVLPQDLPQTDQTTGEMLGEMAQAAGMIGLGAMGISGFAGLHGMPGISSLFNLGAPPTTGLDSILGGGGGGIPGAGGYSATSYPVTSAGQPQVIGQLNPSTGLWSDIGGSQISSALQQVASNQGKSMAQLLADAWTENGVPMSAGEAQAYIDAGGTGINATQGGGFWDAVKNLFTNGSGSTVNGITSALQSSGLGGLLGTAMTGLGSYLNQSSAQDASKTLAQAQIEAARIAADAAKFRPVGVTTRFGQSQFGYDPQGNLTSAGYTVAPDVKALQDRLMGMTGGLMSQYEGAQGATAPMGNAAARAMALGQGYLATTPQEQAAQYMAEQQALLAPTREREFASLENRLLQQGRLGLATGGTSTGLGAANPELEAFYNAQRMQDLNLAAQATQGGMDYAKFGTGMVGAGGDLLKSMYGTQTAAYDPFKTAMGGATYLEGLGQQPMDMGINIGAKGQAGAAQAGQLLSSGIQQSAQTMYPSQAYSPWGALLTGGGNMLSSMSAPQQQQQTAFQYDPYTGRRLV